MNSINLNGIDVIQPLPCEVTWNYGPTPSKHERDVLDEMKRIRELLEEIKKELKHE